LIFLFCILSYLFFIHFFSCKSPTATISASVPKRMRMVVVVRSFPYPDNACRRSRGHATTSEFLQTLATIVVKSPPF
jgi:hypothetical protein